MIPNKLRYLALLAVIGLLSILYNEYFMGMIFLTVAALPLLMLGMLSYIYGMVSAELISTVHIANRGASIPVTIQIHNPTIFPISNITIYLTYKNSFSQNKFKREFKVSVDGRTNASLICNIFSAHAGNLEVSLVKIRIYDYLKLFSLKKKQRGQIKIAVLPHLNELEEDQFANRLKMMVESDYFSQVKSGDDPSEVFTIREYREGDRLQRIHWKLSMKEDRLMIKEFSEPLNCSMLVFANLSVPQGEDPLVYMDSLMECALSLSYTFFLKGQNHYFSWFDASHGACRRIRIAQEKDIFEAMDGLLQTGPYSEGIDVMTAYLAEHPNDQYTDLFYVSGEVSELQLDSLSMIKANYRQIIYVNDTERFLESRNGHQYMKLPISEEAMKIIAEMGIGLLSVDTQNVKRNMEELRLV
ncbi:MAG TPA: DUF58 domain-containing protein [Mobilitalea sp.]|nr:DUF58 domain-containing protein [Mobilitalea sp.]